MVAFRTVRSSCAVPPRHAMRISSLLLYCHILNTSAFDAAMMPVNKNHGTRRETIKMMPAAQPCVFIVVLTAH